MENSILIAQVIGPIYLAIGIGLLTNASYYDQVYKEFLKGGALLYFGAVMALIFGSFLVAVHNVWVQSWEVLITIIAWGALIKGVLLAVFPEASLRTFNSWNMSSWRQVGGVIVIIFGGVFLYYGYIV